MSIGPLKSSFFLLAKGLGRLVDSMNVDTKSIEMFKKLTQQNRKIRIVIMPIYKSYIDPLVLHYINYFTDQELGFTFGHYEDSHKIKFIDAYLKTNGNLPMRRDPLNSLNVKKIKGGFMNKEVINYVNQSLFQEILENNPITTMFQNDVRMRTGKINMPLCPDPSIKILLKTFENLRKGKYDIKIIPVCINYDRLFDSAYLSNEVVSGQYKNFNFGQLMFNIQKMP